MPQAGGRAGKFSLFIVRAWLHFDFYLHVCTTVPDISCEASKKKST
jgi:hypothetical protein